ncbi:MAG: hypothetical protein IIB02_06760 [Thaumarchaeota archaeon]|nr:hypothetical protein [Nitrososphaerota archaeon]
MEFYDEVWFWQLTTLAVGILGIAIMFRNKKQGDKESSIEKYNQHLKSLVNSIYDVCPSTSNGNRKPYYFDEIEKHSNKGHILQHFLTLKESKNDKKFDTYKELQDISQKIKEKRSEQNKTDESVLQQKLSREGDELDGKRTKLKDDFGILFQSFNDKINSIIKSDFGACSECVDSVYDKKMREKYNKIL